jgi:histidyl-tRNA synthetase
MFRHERPQKGRYRQFHQFGVEAFGMAGPDIDAEILQLSASLWKELDLSEYLTLQINNIGNAEDRSRYGIALTEFLKSKAQQLDEDARNRIYTNPMRVLESKIPEVQQALQGCPKLQDFVSEASQEHYLALQGLLMRANIPFIENARLVRGLDYYNYCVYEWTTESLGAQGAVCGGGRYDGLVEMLGGKPTLAAGFAIGIERLVLMLDSLGKIPEEVRKPIDVYVLVVGANLAEQALELVQRIRTEFPQLGVVSHCGGGKYNSQLKRAFNSGARLAVILEREDTGSNDLKNAKIRRLEDSKESETVEIANILPKLGEFLQNSGS